jgi:hypothetical protein
VLEELSAQYIRDHSLLTFNLKFTFFHSWIFPLQIFLYRCVCSAKRSLSPNLLTLKEPRNRFRQAGNRFLGSLKGLLADFYWHRLGTKELSP